MKRLFVAIKIVPSESTINTYKTLRNNLSSNKIKWTDAENFHLTLKFLGLTHNHEIPNIIEVIKNTIHDNSFLLNLNLSKIGVFGSSYKPRIIWFGFEKNNELEKLVTNLINNLEVIGFAKDSQNFVPHISIGRINKVTDKISFNNAIKNSNLLNQEIAVSKIVLLESVLSKMGTKYNEIYSFEIKS